MFYLYAVLVISSVSTHKAKKYYLQNISNPRFLRLCENIIQQPVVKVSQSTVSIILKCSNCTCPLNVIPFKFTCVRKGCTKEEISFEKTLVEHILFNKLTPFIQQTIKDPFKVIGEKGSLLFWSEPGTWPPNYAKKSKLSLAEFHKAKSTGISQLAALGAPVQLAVRCSRIIKKSRRNCNSLRRKAKLRPQLSTGTGSNSNSKVAINTGNSNFSNVSGMNISTGGKAGMNGISNGNTNSYGNFGGFGVPNSNFASNSGSKGKLESLTSSNNAFTWGNNGPVSIGASKSGSQGNMGSGGGSLGNYYGGFGIPQMNTQSGVQSNGNIGSNTGSGFDSRFKYGNPFSTINSGSKSGGNMGSNGHTYGGYKGYGIDQSSNSKSGSGGNLGTLTGGNANIGFNNWGIPTMNIGGQSNTYGKGGSQTNSSNNADIKWRNGIKSWKLF